MPKSKFARRSAIFVSLTFAAFTLVGVGYQWGHKEASTKVREITLQQNLREMVEKSRSEYTKGNLAYDWLDCQERYLTEDQKAAEKYQCHTWNAQGVTSSLTRLRFGDRQLPVIETRLDGIPDNGRIVIDIQGGPGGEPFGVNPNMTAEHIARLKEVGAQQLISGEIKTSPYYELMKRGFTIVSLGYWGTNMRTLSDPGEIELALDDVRNAIDFYQRKSGVEPSLLTVSLGNHLALGALGSARLEATNVLALVPVMDGLQYHIRKSTASASEKRAEAEAKGGFWGEYVTFNIYNGSAEASEFSHSEMLPMHEFVPNFVGERDFPWEKVKPKRPCSRIVLGTKDPRTEEYLDRTPKPADFVVVLESDHNVIRDAPERTREIFAEFAECLIATAP